MRSDIGDELVDEILSAPQTNDVEIAAQRARVAALDDLLDALATPEATRLAAATSHLIDKSVWIVGGDGWAYDIGSGGLDHVLASGHNVNILVLDTEVYSNTGGQASKATPRAAIAKFAARGKRTRKKDLGLIASQYGDVYVAQIALGANYNQTIKAFMEAEAWPGPSLIIAYSTCIAHGIDMKGSMSHQKEAVQSGYWPLFRYQPGADEHEHPFHLDSKKPTIPLKAFTESEARFAMLRRSDPEEAERLLALAQEDIDERWRLYEQTAGVERSSPPRPEKTEG